MFDEIVVPDAFVKASGKARKRKEQLPIPEGKLVIKRLSPREAEKMKRLGISSQEILPENFEAIAISALEQVTGTPADDVVAGIGDTEDELMQELEARMAQVKPRVKSTNYDINDLPEDKREAYLALVSEHLEKYKKHLDQEDELAKLPANLARSVREADIDVEVDDADDDHNTAEDSVAADIEGRKAATTKTAANDKSDKPDDSKHTGEFCARCGFPKADKFDVMQVSAEEEERYLAAAATLSDYEQTRSALSGRLKLTFRVMTVDDEDSVWQAMSDLPNSSNNNARALELLQRYRLALQLKSVKLADGRNIVLPGSYNNWQKTLKAKNVSDTSLETCWEVFKSTLKLTESLRRVLFREMFMFNGIVQRLEEVSAQENLRNF